MSHRWCALWCSVTIFACGPPDNTGPGIVFSPCAPVHLVPRGDTTSPERASIIAAIALWQRVGVRALSLGASTDSLEDAVPMQFKDASPLMHGVYEPSSGLVSINRVLTGTEREVTVAHELGHALGLPHVDRATRSSVMNPSNLTILPSPDDVGELQRRWGCPL